LLVNQIKGQCLTNTDCSSGNCGSGKCSGILKLITKNFYLKDQNIYFIVSQYGGKCQSKNDCSSGNCVSGKCNGI
jgi:hypothetical protein